MKTAISIPDDLFRAIEDCARRLKLSRSLFFATAAREYLVRHGAPEGATEAWNRVADITSADDQRAAAALRRRSKAVIRGAVSRRA